MPSDTPPPIVRRSARTGLAQSSLRQRPPRQHRARMTLAAIHEAALKILDNDGEAAFNTNRVAAVAGISVGTLYRYFPNKEAIIDSLCNELLHGSLAEMSAISERSIELARQSLEAVIEQIVEVEIARHRRILALLKSYYRDIHWHYDYEHHVVSNLPERMHTADWLQKVLGKYRHELVVTDVALAARLVVHLIEGTIHSALSREPELVQQDTLAVELSTAVLRYLKGDSLRGQSSCVPTNPTSPASGVPSFPVSKKARADPSRTGPK